MPTPRMWCARKRVCAAAVIVGGVFASATTAATAQAYEYSIRPGTAAWRALSTHKQMVEAVRIPREALDRLSDAELAQACLDYPLLGDMLLFNGLQQGFDRVASQFDGLQQLIVRPGALRGLAQQYVHTDPQLAAQAANLVEQGEWSARQTFMEIILAQPAALSAMTATERSELLNNVLDKLDARRRLPQVYGLQSYHSGAWLLARLVDHAKGSVQLWGRQLDREIVRDFVDRGALVTRVEVLEQAVVAARAMGSASSLGHAH